MKSENIKEIVRESYGNVAGESGEGCGCDCAGHRSKTGWWNCL